MEEGRGKVTDGMGGMGQDMGWDGEGREMGRKGRRGAIALPNFNSWRRHWCSSSIWFQLQICPALLITVWSDC